MERLFVTIRVFIILACVSLNKAQNATNSSSATNSTSIPLYIGAFFNLDTKDGYGALPMAYQAIEEINNNTDMLPGYRLELVVNSTQGSLAHGQQVFQEFLNTGPNKIMLLGPLDDSLAKSVAAYSGLPDVRLLQFSYGTSDLELASRRDLYPLFFRTVTSAASLDAPRIKFIEEYGWDEVGIIYGDSVQYLKLSNQLAGRLKQNKIKVLAEVRLQENDPHRAVRTMKDKGVHVILGMFSNNQASTRKMICEAYRQKMYGPHYVWILLNSRNNNWWIPRKGEQSACSDLEMKCQIQNHFSVYHTTVTDARGKIYKHVGKNRSEIISDYQAQVDNYTDTSNRSSYYLNVYDAVWSIAFVLNNSRKELERDYGKRFENLTYGDKNVSDLFARTALALDFPTPSTGQRVRYYSNGNRKNAIVMKEIVLKDGKFKTVGAGGYNVETGDFTASSQINWLAGTPYVKTTEKYIYRTIDRILFIVLVLFASLGIVYALFCLIMLVLNFKKKIIQNSAPVISVLIILGCILNYVTVILYGFDYSLVSSDTVSRLCRARSWTFAIGFTASVGGLAAKLWIAYSVLKDRFVRSKNVMMFWMLGIVVLLLVIDIIILACWEGTDALTRVLKQVRSQPEYKCFEPITADTFRAQIEVVEHCDCADLILWLAVVLVFKALILLAGGFLAWQTRRLYIPALNDSKHCVNCIFLVLLFCVVGVIVALTTTMYPSVFYGVIGSLIVIATTFILVVLFINKIIRLTCNRKRTKIVVGGATSEDTTCGSCGSACAKFCSCCACSPACCITCCSCFPCCNPYLCLRKFFFGNRVNPAGDGDGEKEVDFYIGGVPQDRDAEIVYLKNEIRERDSQLSKLGGNKTVKSNATQTVGGDDSYLWSSDDDGMRDRSESGSDVETVVGEDGKRRFRRAARNVKIFNQGMDYSHIRSKVDTRRKQSSLTPGSPLPRRGSRAMSSTESIEELSKLRSTLAQKEKEILRLRKELGGQNVLTSEQVSTQTSPMNHPVVLLETITTSGPVEKVNVVSSSVPALTVSSSPPQSQVKTYQYSSDDGLGTRKDRKISKDRKVSKEGPQTSKMNAQDTTNKKNSNTQDRTNKKNSLGAAGSWLFSYSPNDYNESPGETESVPRKHSNDNNKSSYKSNQLNGKDKKTSPDADRIKPEPEDSHRTSLTNVVISVNQQRESSPTGMEGTKLSSDAEKENGPERKADNMDDTAGDEGSQATNEANKDKEGEREKDKAAERGDEMNKEKSKEHEEGEKQQSKDDSKEDKNKDKASEGNDETKKEESKEKEEKTEEEREKQERKDDSKQHKNKNKASEGSNETKEEESTEKEEKTEEEREKQESKDDSKQDESKDKASEGSDETKKEESTEKEEKTEEEREKQQSKDDPKQDKMTPLESSSINDEDTESADPRKLFNTADKEDTKKSQEDKKENDVSSKDINGNLQHTGGSRDNQEKKEDEKEENSTTSNDENEMEMIDEEDEEDGDEEEEESEEGEGNSSTEATGTNTSTNGKPRKRRKKLGYGKLKWNAESKVDTGGGGYRAKRGRKRIPRYKNDYSHVRSRLSTLGDSNKSGNPETESSVERKTRKTSLPDYSKARPRLYNGVKKPASEIPGTGTGRGYQSMHVARQQKRV